MKSNQWTLEEFKAYLYIYCTFADHLQLAVERNYAIEKVGKDRFSQMHKEIEKDTDDVSINKIRQYVKANEITEENIKKMLDEIEELFVSDGQFHKLERRLFNSLQHILTKSKKV